MLTVAEAASLLRCSRGLVYKLVAEGTLPAIRRPRFIRIDEADLCALKGKQWQSAPTRPAVTESNFSRAENAYFADAPRAPRGRKQRSTKPNSGADCSTNLRLVKNL